MELRLTSKDRAFKTVVEVGNASVGKGLVVIAGPCSIESREQFLAIARYVKSRGADMLRGGAFKPRTSPYSFQGLGVEGLEILAEARRLTGMPAVTEVMEPAQVELVASFADMLQIGARNMQNFPLLRSVGEQETPVLLKRGISSTIEEWLMAAEHIMSRGNDKVILCERGIRTFEKSTRFTLDISAVPVLRTLTHLPVIVDPSHAAGRRDLIIPLTKAAAAAGADGVMVEIHVEPEAALSDGAQCLTFQGFDRLMSELKEVRGHGRCLRTESPG